MMCVDFFLNSTTHRRSKFLETQILVREREREMMMMMMKSILVVLLVFLVDYTVQGRDDPCSTSFYETCMQNRECVWGVSTHSCVHRNYTTGLDLTKISHRNNFIGLTWKKYDNSSGEPDVMVGVSYDGYAYSWNKNSDVNTQIGPLTQSNNTYGGHGGVNIVDETNKKVGKSYAVVPTEWDIVCQDGGQKRWEKTKKQNGNSIPGMLYGNTECQCLYGGAGSTCSGCATDDYCYAQKRLIGEKIDPGAKITCDKSVSFGESSVQFNCYPVHNGCTTSDFANDTVLLLLNDYIDGLTRMTLDISKDGISGGLLKPVDHFGYRQTLASPHLFRMQTGSGVGFYLYRC